ncbi:hypothetical protein AAF712_004765 [Marasmius tenuissimus]|uniref:RRM domain-containing protein n=1 Tax=Marasmius tenuissimus TaxID=585030 RepID=A0ABR3A3M8_9AGAR
MSSLRSLHLSARQLVRPCSLSQLQASSSRLFATEATTEPQKQSNRPRTVILHGVSSLNDVSKVLDEHKVGPVERIQYQSEKGRAFISFLGFAPALAFKNSIKASQPDADVRLYRGEQHGPLAAVVGAIALRSASRCMVLKPSPPGATEESLAEELRRFGLVEKVEIVKKPEGDTFAKVHFDSISSAMKAVLNLRVEQSMKGTGIFFAPDRLDSLLRQKLKQSQQSSPDITNESSCTVVLDGLKTPADWRQIAALVRNATPASNGSVLSSLTFNPEKTDAYLNFFRPADATLFANAFNSQVPKPLPASGSATLLPPKKIDPFRYQLSRAADLGATRTLAIFNIKDWSRINRKQIFEDFSKFGFILDIRVQKSRNTAYIEYADVMGAFQALDRIHNNNRNFRRYSGTSISFAQPKDALKPVAPLFIRVDTPAASDVDAAKEAINPQPIENTEPITQTA